MSVLQVAKTAVSSKAGKLLLLGKKFSPEILTVAGVVGVVVGVVLVAKSSTKVVDTFHQYDEEIDDVKIAHDHNEITDAKFREELAKLWLKRTVGVVELYAPGALLVGVGLSCLVGSSYILKKRNVAAVAAYNVLKDQYDRYRENVRDFDGEEKDRQYRLGLEERKVTDIHTGKEITVKTGNPARYSQYARIFDELNYNFNKHHRESNLAFLLSQQTYATQRLHSKGFLVLNDVYDALGLPETPDGAVVGWVLDNDGDNFVDFGIFDLESEAARDFVNGYEPAIVLDFNVDGFIQDKIGRTRP